MQKSASDYGGMTTNERLFVAGLLTDFDNAVARGDGKAVSQILKQVFVDQPSIMQILEDLGLEE